MIMMNFKKFLALREQNAQPQQAQQQQQNPNMNQAQSSVIRTNIATNFKKMFIQDPEGSLKWLNDLYKQYYGQWRNSQNQNPNLNQNQNQNVNQNQSVNQNQNMNQNVAQQQK